MDIFTEIVDYIDQGGVVMIPILVVSIWMWTLIAERILTLGRLGVSDLGPSDPVRVLRTGNLPDGARGLRAQILKEFLQERTGFPELDIRILELCVMRVRPMLFKSLSSIAVLAGVAPLLGLLGTVIGMIFTFEVLSVFGTGNAKALAGGISEALITTQSGLLIAIPGLYMSAYLNRRAHRLYRRLEEMKMAIRRQLLSREAT